MGPRGDKFSAAFSPAATPEVRSTELACPPDRVRSPYYADVPGHHEHQPAIRCAAWWEVVQGEDGSYHPDRTLTRGQLASIVAKTITEGGGDLPAEPRDHFDDDDGTFHETAINQLAEVGVVTGVAPSRYGPHGDVTRGQMASILRHATEHVTGTDLPEGDDHYGDDHGTTHEAAINAITSAGLASGVAPGHFLPAREVTRGQVASFVVRVLDLLVERGHAVPPDERAEPEPEPDDDGSLDLPEPLPQLTVDAPDRSGHALSAGRRAPAPGIARVFLRDSTG